MARNLPATNNLPAVTVEIDVVLQVLNDPQLTLIVTDKVNNLAKQLDDVRKFANMITISPNFMNFRNGILGHANGFFYIGYTGQPDVIQYLLNKRSYTNRTFQRHGVNGATIHAISVLPLAGIVGEYEEAVIRKYRRSIRCLNRGKGNTFIRGYLYVIYY
jgi:hypothetical protein